MRICEIIENPEYIKVWHGSRKWEGEPEIRGHKKGRAEAGVGIYCTTNYHTAAKYSKGGGSTLLFYIDPNLNFAYDVEIPLDNVLDFLKNNRIKNKKEIATDLRDNLIRTKRDNVRAQILINLMVNYGAASGQAGKNMVDFLVANGVDASLENQSNNEQWLVILNVSKIKKIEKIAAKDVTPEMYHLPRIKD